MHKSKRKCLKRLFSIFLAFTLFIGGLTVPQLSAVANHAMSDILADSGDDSSPVSASLESGAAWETESASENDALQTNLEDFEHVGDEISSDAFYENPETPVSSVSGNTTSETPEESEETEEEAVSSDTIDETLDQASAEVIYTLTIDYNGGIDMDGNTSYQVQANAGDPLSHYLQEAESKNFYSPYKFANKWVLTYTDTGKEDSQNYRKANTTKKVTDNYTLKAQWSDTYATFDIYYELNGGEVLSDEKEHQLPYSYTYVTDTITLPEVMKKGFLFKGFYKDADFTVGPVREIPTNSMGDITLYAKWETAAPTEIPVLTKAANTSTGTVTVNFNKLTSCSGYELLMSTSKTFKKNVNTISLKASAGSAKLTNMPKGKTYYFKLRAFNYDSTGEMVYSSYSNVLKIKITKGVKEYNATSTSATLKSCSIKDGSILSVKFKVPKRAKSADDSYYLVRLNPSNGKYEKMVEKSPKLKTVTFELPLRDSDGNDLIQGKFALAVKSGKSYKIISKGAFISNPEAAASYQGAFPVSRTKKGLQGSTDSDLGLSHTFFNMDLNSILNGSIPYKYNGKTYYFNDPWSGVISACNDAGLTVTGQIMLSYNEKNKYMILKGARTPGKAYYAINVQDKKARETFEAAMNFLGERYGREDCHLDNWIIGNEVNIHQVWYYAGNISQSAFMKNYADTFRIMYYGVRSHSANSRVYICTDHTWSNRHNDWGAKPFMDAFNKEIKSQQKNIQWNLAYHAYPSILTSAATWNDKYTTNSNDSEFVSPKNLNILTNYVKKNFGSKTRIILSEQGFTSTSGKDVQAAAIAYTYYKAEFNPMIDAVIFRSDIDAQGEMAQGLYFGLKDASGNKKPAYDVFKYMDTPQAEQYTNPYLKTIGISKWKDIAPKYTLKRFQ